MDNLVESPALRLVGCSFDNGWKVVSFVHRPATATGGRFSVGYHVQHKDGRNAFLKALDFSAAFQSPDPARTLEAMTTAYNFERNLLQVCKTARMRRISIPLADGSISVPGFGPLGTVMYIIFELAAGDIRSYHDSLADFDLAWCLRSLHNTAVGLSQLHRAGIAHQDLKPSNVLYFPDDGSKVSDLGRASYRLSPSATDQLQVPGDTSYAPPEQRYGYRCSASFDYRYAADIYHLGSLMFFHFAGNSATGAVIAELAKNMGHRSYNDDFRQDIAYWESAFHHALDSLRSDVEPIAHDLSEDIILLARYLCEPDPLKRGHPKNVSQGFDQYGLERIVTRLNILAKTAEYRLK